MTAAESPPAAAICSLLSSNARNNALQRPSLPVLLAFPRARWHSTHELIARKPVTSCPSESPEPIFLGRRGSGRRCRRCPSCGTCGAIVTGRKFNKQSMTVGILYRQKIRASSSGMTGPSKQKLRLTQPTHESLPSDYRSAYCTNPRCTKQPSKW